MEAGSIRSLTGRQSKDTKHCLSLIKTREGQRKDIYKKRLKGIKNTVFEWDNIIHARLGMYIGEFGEY